MAICDVDIEPEDLVPEYIAAKARLLELSRCQSSDKAKPPGADLDTELAVAKLEAKLLKIENDVLFDKFVAEQRWKVEKAAMEKQLATVRRQAQAAPTQEPKAPDQVAGGELSGKDSVAAEAERVAAEILAENDDDGIAELFASLPQNEVDPETGKSQLVMSSMSGGRIVIRDFGDWSGIKPRRVLEEACRSRQVVIPTSVSGAVALLTRNRDASVKIHYDVVSEAAFASRQSVDISWTKPQEIPQSEPSSDVEIVADRIRFTLTMAGVATPDARQSEAYIATSALFHIFSGNAKDEKVALRLPPAWRDLWNEMAEARKNRLDSQDREVVRSLRTLVRQRHDQELEDGVILQGAFRGRGIPKASQDSSGSGQSDRKGQDPVAADEIKKTWANKSGTRRFQAMLVRHRCGAGPVAIAVLTGRAGIALATPHVAVPTAGFGHGQPEPGRHRMWRDGMVSRASQS